MIYKSFCLDFTIFSYKFLPATVRPVKIVMKPISMRERVKERMKEDSSKEYKIYLYLFIRRIPTPAIAGSVCINAKKGDNKERTNE